MKENISEDITIAAGQLHQERKFWKSKLSGELEKSYFPYDSSTKDRKGQLSGSVATRFDDPLAARLLKLSGNSDPRLHMVLTAGLAVLLSRYIDNNDILIGTSIDKQPQEKEGLLVNTILPLRIPIKDGMSFKELLVQLKDIVNEAIENQNYPIEQLVTEMDMIASDNEFPLFEVSIILQNIQEERYIEHIPHSILFSFLHKGDAIEWKVKYNAALYEQATIERITAHYVLLLNNAVFNLDMIIEGIQVIPEAEKQELLQYFNTRSEYPITKTIHELFADQVVKTPGNIAVMDKKTGHGKTGEMIEISYLELNRAAGHTAAVLRSKGIKPGAYAAILAERSLEFLIAILGTLKAGGAYIPIDPEYPAERRNYMLDNSGVSIVLSQEHLKQGITCDNEVLGIEPFISADAEEADVSRLEQLDRPTPNDPVYIIYTSGSTGKPKGVVVEHRGLVNYAWWAAQNYVPNETLHFPLFTSISFDLTVTSIFVPLITGGAVVVYRGELGDILIDRIIDDNKVGVVKLTPSHLGLIKDKKVTHSTIKRFILGGEILETQICRQIYENFAGHIEIYNEYGPTEATVGCMIHRFDPQEDTRLNVPIGIPAANTRIYLLDKKQRIIPTGAVGEIYIAGDGVAQGYLGEPGLNEAKFLVDPFTNANGGRMYRTGDLGRRLNNGKIDFLGRIDNQVKIRGYRIELAEIEAELAKLQGIKEVIVCAGESPDGDKSLRAYFAADREIFAAEFREFLAGILPEYMIPSYFIQLDKIPLNPNGKVNTKALPEPEGNVHTGITYRPPETDLQKTMVIVWQEVLRVDPIGLDDNYFSLGGDSIKAIQLVSRLQKYRLKLEISHLFQFPTIGELSAFVQSVTHQVSQEPVAGEVRLSPIQKWFFEKNNVERYHFNLSVMLQSSAEINTEILEKALKKLLEHHDVLRMVYRREEDDTIKQINRGSEAETIDIAMFDLRGKSEYKKIILEKADAIQRSVNINDGGILLKTGLFKTGAGDYLLLAFHHLVMDTVSLRIIAEDLELSYKQVQRNMAVELPLKTTSFKEWVEELYRYASMGKLLEELSYWKSVEETHTDTLPREKIADDNRNCNTHWLTFKLSKVYTGKLLKEVHKAYNTEINDILLSGLALALNQWAKLETAAIHLEGHGREEIIEEVDINRTVGWFTSLFPVVIEMRNTTDISRVIKHTKEILRAVPNKGIGYGILRYLTPADKKQGVTFKLKPEIGFNYLGRFDNNVRADIFNPADISPGNTISPEMEREYTLDVLGFIPDEELEMMIAYNKEEFAEENISILCQAYETSLKTIIDHCVAKEETEATASDYTSSDFDEAELDSIAEELAESFNA